MWSERNVFRFFPPKGVSEATLCDFVDLPVSHGRFLIPMSIFLLCVNTIRFGSCNTAEGRVDSKRGVG